MNDPILLCDNCVTNQVGEEFSLWVGLNESHKQAVLNSAKNDPLIVNNTSDGTRFSSPEKLDDWLSGERIFYVLTPKDMPNELSGLIWFSAEDLITKMAEKVDLATNWTFAIRIYEQARGKRLSTPFMKQAFEYFWQNHPQQPVWLSTNADNQLAKKIYQKFGFKLIGEDSHKAYYLIQS